MSLDYTTPPLPSSDEVKGQALAEISASEVKRAGNKALPVSPEIMQLDGALALFVDHCNVTAISPQPFLALAAGVCAVGALAGRRYRTESGLATNIYAVGIADSGGGKDHARKQIVKAFAAAGLTQYLGGDEVASGQAISAALERFPSQIMLWDEFGETLRDILSSRSAPHRKLIASKLKTLYSSSDGLLKGTEYSQQSGKDGRPRVDIHHPNLCLYATTTPLQFWRAVDGASLEGGLMARLLVFLTEVDYPDYQRPHRLGVPLELVNAFKEIAAGPIDPATGERAAPMSATIDPKPFVVPLTDDADQALSDMRNFQLELCRKHEGTYFTSIAGRLSENATKLALVRAVSRDPRYPTITVTDIKWGRAVSQHCVDTLLREATDNVADNPFARSMQMAKKIIRKHGPISAYEMTRKGWAVPSRERDEVLRALVESEQVVAIEIEGGKGKGQPTVRYKLAPEALAA